MLKMYENHGKLTEKSSYTDTPNLLQYQVYNIWCLKKNYSVGGVNTKH